MTGIFVTTNLKTVHTGLSGLVLRTSNLKGFVPNIDGSGWSERTKWLIKNRLGGKMRGVQKGRVIAVWQADKVIAVCAWHLEDPKTGSKPRVRIYEIECHESLKSNAEGCKIVRECILSALLAIQSKVGNVSNNLEWSDEPLKRAPSGRRKSWIGESRKNAQMLGFSQAKGSRGTLNRQL